MTTKTSKPPRKRSTKGPVENRQTARRGAPKVAEGLREAVSVADIAGMLQKVGKVDGVAHAATLAGANAEAVRVVAISTGLPSLDKATGVGGIPLGRIVEAYGKESGGKTTLALKILASFQKQGFACAMIDAEHAFNPAYAELLGVDLETLIFSQPDSGESALKLAEALVESGVQYIVVDSVAALTPQAEIDGEIGDAHVGLQARMMGQALRKMASKVAQSKAVVVFINQVRDKIGGTLFGPKTTTPGGKALKFYASLRMEVTRIGAIKKGEEIVGSRVQVKVVKNKVAPPFKVAVLELSYAWGLDELADVLDLALAQDVITKSGNWHNYGETKLGNGREACKDSLRAQPELVAEIKGKLS